MNSRKANLEVMPEAYVSKEEIMTFRMYVMFSRMTGFNTEFCIKLYLYVMKNIKGMVNKAGREKALPGICKFELNHLKRTLFSSY